MTIIEDVHLQLSRCVDAVIELRRQNTLLLEALDEIQEELENTEHGTTEDAVNFALGTAVKAIALVKGESGFDTAQRVLENLRKR